MKVGYIPNPTILYQGVSKPVQREKGTYYVELDNENKDCKNKSITGRLRVVFGSSREELGTVSYRHYRGIPSIIIPHAQSLNINPRLIYGEQMPVWIRRSISSRIRQGLEDKL